MECLGFHEKLFSLLFELKNVYMDCFGAVFVRDLRGAGCLIFGVVLCCNLCYGFNGVFALRLIG